MEGAHRKVGYLLGTVGGSGRMARGLENLSRNFQQSPGRDLGTVLDGPFPRFGANRVSGSFGPINASSHSLNPNS
jgi:hypothetical protein